MEVLPQEAETLAERFRDAGYDTAAFISNPFVSPRYGFSQGFDVFERRELTKGLLAAATEWLDQRTGKGTAPFFLYLHFMDVHGPYQPARRDFETVLGLIDPDVTQRLTAEEYAQIPAYLKDTDWADDGERFYLRSWQAKYGAGVLQFDRQIGPFLDALRNRGVLDRGYLVLTADHGEELMEHGGWNHGENVFDQQLHIPLLIRKPLSEDAGRRAASLVSLIDLMPTLLSLARLEAPPGLAGRDLSPLMQNDSGLGVEAVFVSAVIGRPSAHAVRTQRQKLIWDASSQELALFDLLEDPYERDEQSAHDKRSLELLKQHLRDHMMEMEKWGPLSPETLPLTEELRDQLKALGYVP